MADPIALVEAAYAPAASEAEWLDGVARASRPMLDEGRGVLAFIHDTTAPDWVEIRAVHSLDVAPTLAAALFNAPMERGDETRAMVRIFRTLLATTAQREIPRAPPVLRAQFERGLRAAGLADARFVNATDPSGAGVAFVGPAAALKRLSPREVHNWRRLAAHVSTGLRMHRLRTDLLAMRDRAPFEAVFRPDGHLEHAEGPARGVDARAALRLGVLAQERARGPLRREDAEGALALWEGLVAGRWSLVDQFDSDGRRYLVAHRNDPEAPDLRGLTLRERQVVAYAASGHPNKVIAYELGLTMSTVASHLAQARAKLALPSAASIREALALFAPSPSAAEENPH